MVGVVDCGLSAAAASGFCPRHVPDLRPAASSHTAGVRFTDQRGPGGSCAAVSAPASYSRDVARRVGRFYTLGIAQDTSALRQGVFTLTSSFRRHAWCLTMNASSFTILWSVSTRGCCFSTSPRSMRTRTSLWGQHEAELLDLYRGVDECVGEVIRKQPSADVIVMSDHGFTTFSRAVNLNTWLYDGAFSRLAARRAEGVSIRAADWRSTEAYGLGLNGLYLNLAGREKNGSVPRGERSRALIEACANSCSHSAIPKRAPKSSRLYCQRMPPPRTQDRAPDLIVGYARGYRASWQTALGEIPPMEIMPNDDAWIADHCINAEDVPGVLFTNRRISAGRRAIQDVTVSILDLFGVAPANGMSGRSFYHRAEAK